MRLSSSCWPINCVRNGVLRLATDWQAYAEQMLEVCNACARSLR